MTFVLTYEARVMSTGASESISVPFCSESCAYENHVGDAVEFERYEFDETCAHCGTEILASV